MLRNKKILLTAITVCAVAFFVFQQFMVLLWWTPVPFIDTWPVLHRFMQWDMGGVSFLDYLLLPHGSHLHSIVYLTYWIDLMFFGGQQWLPLVVSEAATFAMCGLAIWMFTSFGKSEGWSSQAVTACAVAGLLAIGMPNGASLHIFQVVLTASRAADYFLIAGLVISLSERKLVLQIALLIAACVVGTFHGSGLLFCLVLLLLHLVLGRSWKWRISGLVPLVVVVIVNKLFIPSGSGEFAAMLSVVSNLTPNRIVDLSMGALAYYLTPWGYWWSGDLVLNDAVLALGAAITMLITTAWSVWTAAVVGTRVWRRQPVSKAESLRAGIAVAGLMVPISALSAALFFEARNVLEPGMYPSVYAGVLAARRYACFAILGYLQLLFIFASIRNRAVSRVLVFIGAFLILVPIIVMQSTLWERRSDRFELEKGTYTLFDPTGDAVKIISNSSWTGVSVDPYWTKELPKLTRYLEDRNLSIYRGIKTQGALSSEDPIWPISSAKLSSERLPGSQSCRFTGEINLESMSGIGRPTFVNIVSSSKLIVGHASLIPRVGRASQNDIEGAVSCDQSQLGNFFAGIGRAPLLEKTQLCSDVLKSAPVETLRLQPVNYTDANWKNGVWNKSDAQHVFFVEAIGLDLPPCSTIRFESGSTSGIASTMLVQDKYLNIYVAGELNPDADGYPHTAILTRPVRTSSPKAATKQLDSKK